MCDEITGRGVIILRLRGVFGWLSVGYDVIGLERVDVVGTGGCVGVEHALVVVVDLSGGLVVVC